MSGLRKYTPKLNAATVLYGIAAFAALYVITSEAVSRAFLDFCFGGVVPFTGHVIAPQVMLTASIIAIGSIASVLLFVWLLRIRAVKRVTIADHTAGSPTPAELRIARRASAKAKSQPAVPPHPVTIWVRRVLRQQSTRAVEYAWIAKLLSIGRHILRPIIQVVGSVFTMARHVIIQIVHILGRIVMGSIAVLLLAIETGLSVTATQARRAGMWIKPRAERFDTWLELQYRTMSRWIGKRLSAYEPLQVLMSMVRESTNTLRRMFK